MAMVQLIGYTPDDVYIPTGPLYHSGPGGFMGIAQALGQTVVLQRRFDPEDWLRLVDTLPHHVDLLRPDAHPHDLHAAGRGEGPLRPLVDEADGGQRRARGRSRSSSCTWPTSRPTRCGRCTARPSSA